MLQRVLDEVLIRERLILTEHGLPMWDYVALVRLAEQTAPTQAHLAAAMRRDKNRVIETVDRLESNGLIDRRIDPADRRNRMIGLTPEGRRTLIRTRRDIRAMEDQLLGDLPNGSRVTFLDALRQLDETVTELDSRRGTRP